MARSKNYQLENYQLYSNPTFDSIKITANLLYTFNTLLKENLLYIIFLRIIIHKIYSTTFQSTLSPIFAKKQFKN